LMPPGRFGSTTIDCSACIEKANTRRTADATGAVVALESRKLSDVFASKTTKILLRMKF
jgi:hypothetical protein